MGYYIRRIVTGPPPSLAEIERGAREMDADLTFESSGDASATILMIGDAAGEIDVTVKGENLFDAEIEELLEALDGCSGKGLAKVRDTLNSATAIVAVRVLFGGRDTDEVLDDLEPVLDWLNANCSGLTQADDEGYYDGQDLILEN